MDFLNTIIDFSLRNRLLVVLVSLAAAVAGVLSLTQLDIDAFPDTTPVQVQINTIAPSLAPEEVERQITDPIEQALGGLPGLTQLRSISKFGLSQVVLVFEDGIDIQTARNQVNQRLTTVELPPGLDRPEMGPLATGLGEVFHYIVVGQGTELTDLRTIHDWVIKPAMTQVRGTAEINSWGGYKKQFQVRIDPVRLVKHALSFEQVLEAIKKNNLNVGGGTIEQGSGSVLVQGKGRTATLEEIRGIVIDSHGGVPIRLADVADVVIGHEIRRGAVTANGQGEVVLGLGFMTMGENSHEVTWAMKQKLDELKASLPRNVQVQPVYDRTELVDYVIDTVRKNLFEGGLLVVAVLFAFLGNMRAALIVALAIPLSMLFAFSGMYRFGISASLLSLGAIDFGMIVDSSVVMVENCVRHMHLPANKTRDPLDVIREAAVEVRAPTLFGELIIMIVYLPILTLEGVEGKLFRPMALTVIFALIGSMILSMTLMPVLASYFLPKSIEREEEPFLMRIAHAIHYPILQFAMHHRIAVIFFGLAVVVVALGMIAPHLGANFTPRLSEGAVAIGVVRLAGTDLSESIRANTVMEQRILKEFPDEVEHVWSRIGSAEVATDPMGIELTDTFLALRPRSKWTKAKTQDEFTEKLHLVLRDLKGIKLAYSQPIEMRMNEMTSGVRSDLGVLLYGDEFPVLQAKAGEIEAVLRTIEGNADVAVEQITGQPMLQVQVNQEEIARYGLSAEAVLDLVESIGAKPVGEVVEGQMRFPLVVRLPDAYRDSPEAVKSLFVVNDKGDQIPLSRVAEIEMMEGPSTITREWRQRRIVISANVRGRDLGSFVAEARQKIAAIAMPSPRYRVEYTGQFENFERAIRRLILAGVIALVLVLLLLYFTYNNILDAIRVLTGIPFAIVGGIFALWLRDMPFSIPAGVGFIAMSGVAVLDDMILVSAIRQFRERGLPLDEAVTQAAIMRLRPVLMTTLVASLGFLPMAFSDGMGAEVQRPLATVVIGGVIGAMVMSLLVIRVLYVMQTDVVNFFRRLFGLPVEVESDTYREGEAPAEPDRRTEVPPVVASSQ